MSIYYILIDDKHYREVEAKKLDDVVSFMCRNFRGTKIITDDFKSALMEHRSCTGKHELCNDYAADNGFQKWRPGDPREL